MIYLICSIVFASMLVILFKVFERFGVNANQAIVFNYFTASFCGIVLSYSEFIRFDFLTSSWFPYSLFFGAMFIAVFTLIGISVTRIGITPVSIAQKMSLIIPVGFSIYTYGEPLGIIKFTGILLALTAIVLSSVKKRSSELKRGKFIFFLPLLIFLGSGIIDIFIKLVEALYSQYAGMNLILSCIFGSAGSIGLIALLFRRESVRIKNILAGICLGLVNYASAYFLIKTLALENMDSSVVFPVNNIGVILFSSFIALTVYKEKMNVWNWMGMGLSIIAIVLITYR